MQVALVAMPWAPFNMPSAALGALSAYLHRFEPGIHVDCYNEYISVWSELQSDYELLAGRGRGGELMYAAELYPQKSEEALAEVLATVHSYEELAELRGQPRTEEPLDLQSLRRIAAVLSSHLEKTAEHLAHTYDLVGMTTSFDQLFASLALAERIKRHRPETQIVLGGIGSRRAPGALLREYPYLDYVIRGEGETRLQTLLHGVASERTEFPPDSGIFSRRSSGGDDTSTPLREGCDALDLGEQPPPDYDAYAELADQHSILWSIPVEGSRGCWWDRTLRTGNALQACHFCGTTGSKTYRRKSTEQIGEEVAELCGRYQNTRVLFLDCMVPHRGGVALAEALKRTHMDLQFSIEVRASISAPELLAMREAGCFAIQIGVEGLSTSYLRRINKGTTTIHNLAAMRTCYELGMQSGSNLLTHFPGATTDEVEETREIIQRYAAAYEPLFLSKYSLTVDSGVYLHPERFGVNNIRNEARFLRALPEDVWQRLPLPWLEYDCEGEDVDWQGVRQACLHWRRTHRKLYATTHFTEIPQPLFYFDGGEFLEITDHRHDNTRTIVLDRLLRDIYIFCMEVRSKEQLKRRFSAECSEAELVEEILPDFVAQDLMFSEGDRYLSLAVAWRPEVAAQRIRAAAAQDFTDSPRAIAQPGRAGSKQERHRTSAVGSPGTG